MAPGRRKIMGISGISIWQLGIILAIILLIFGTKKLRGMGGDLGGAVKGFKKAIKEDEKPEEKNGDTYENEPANTDSNKP